MPTNDERREVAARLRNLAGHKAADEELTLDALGLYRGENIEGYDTYGVMQLADLIEPEPERTTHFELIATAVDENGDALAVGVHCAICGLLDEDEIGADPDNWMLWRYCPSCGAKVTP